MIGYLGVTGLYRIVIGIGGELILKYLNDSNISDISQESTQLNYKNLDQIIFLPL